MSSGSVRRIPAVDLHQHEEPPETADREAVPAGGEVPGDDVCDCGHGRLRRDGDKVVYEAEACEPTPVRVLWARPLSGRGGPVSLMQAGKKREIAYLPSLDVLDPASRRIAEEALAASMVLPRILRIREVKPRFGNYYFDVETDKGARRFLLSSPETNSYRPRPDAIVVKDVSGNAYEIFPVSAFDRGSRRELDRVL